MKILVIGSGGREHALVWKIAQSEKVQKIFCAPGNPGTAQYATNIPIPVDDLQKLVSFAKKEAIDLTIVGPEIPLVLGIVDLFEKYHLPIIGPNRKAARIEGSKIFAKKLMKKYTIPTASFEVFSKAKQSLSFIKTQKFPLVVKADGLSAGKGVAVCHNEKEARNFINQLMVDKIFKESGSKIVIEEFLSGQEVSFMVVTDGKNFVSFLPSQDHKRVFDDDRGPNTGGMGAYAPVPFVHSSMIRTIELSIVAPVLEAMMKEGCLYKGILYPGIILTKEGPKVLEFNCRFGDPETQPLMALLESDIIDLFLATLPPRHSRARFAAMRAGGNPDRSMKTIKNIRLKWKKGSAVCVVLTAKGYPGAIEKGKKIVIPSHPGLPRIGTIVTDSGRPESNSFARMTASLIFHSGTKSIDNKLVTNGGRVLGVTAVGKNLKDTRKKVYESIGKNGIYFAGMHFRKDIGSKGLKSLAYGRSN